MRIEPLEQRALLSVSVIEETFKDLVFQATGDVKGTFPLDDYMGNPAEIIASGKAVLEGTIAYDSYGHGEIQVGTVSVWGTWNGVSVDGPINGAWSIDGYANPIMDINGQLTGIVVIDQSDVLPPDWYDYVLNGTYGVGGAKSFFNTYDFSIGMVITNSDGSFTINKGKLTPTETKAFDVVVTPIWSDNGVNVDVEVPGMVHKTKTADRSVPVTRIELYWAKGKSLANKLGSMLPDKIPVYWNQDSGQYEVTDLPSAPNGATHLLFVAKFDGKTKVAALALPTVSVAPTSVVEGNGDASGQTHATFAVSLSQESPLPVTVWFKTVKGFGSMVAKPGSDYQTTESTIVIAAGETQGEIKVPIIGDTTYEPDEKFWVKLTKSKNARIDNAHTFAVGVIENDDDKPSISINDVALAEGNSGLTKFIFTVTLSNPSYQTVQVKYQPSSGSAAGDFDYVSKKKATLAFAPGVTTQTITVFVKGDKEAEPDETFAVKLSAAKNVTISDSEGKATILNDDGPGGQNAATSRDAALNQLAGPGQLAAYFEPLGRKKNDKHAAAADLILAAP